MAFLYRRNISPLGNDGVAFSQEVFILSHYPVVRVNKVPPSKRAKWNESFSKTKTSFAHKATHPKLNPHAEIRISFLRMENMRLLYTFLLMAAHQSYSKTYIDLYCNGNWRVIFWVVAFSGRLCQ